jgi:acyl-[acyl-carrier-protein]-phospholipid O-acyltransferase/long-chain-fatty-acid--[acyl-carrier-protein] ligase
MILHQQFVRIAKKNEKKLAIIDRTLDRRVTYKRALIGSLILVKKFEKYDSGFLGIMMPNSAGSVLAILGTLMGGRVPVMINYSTGAAANCEYAQKKCAFKTIITSKALCEKINCRHVDGMVYLEDVMKSVTLFDKIKAALKAGLPVERLLKSIHGGEENDTLIILFTSGSEKDPKGVQLTHRNISANYESLKKAYSFSSEDIFLANLPYFHVFGQTANLWVPLVEGMTLVTYANPLDFKTISDVVREEKVSIMAGTPTFFWGYVRNSTPGDFASVRIMISGADKCPEALRTAFLKKHGKTLLEAYGTTETSPGITVNTLSHNRPGSTGKPLDGVQVRLENYETGEGCATGEIGKILVKGDNVMKGYFDDFEQTSLSIRHGWYDTGDMGFLDADGYLWHVGRLKRFLKIGGEMVSLVKVEDVLEKLLPPDVECCVVEIPDPLRGARIVAAVTQQVDEKAILKNMAEQLPKIALPSRFVVISVMPKHGSGKIDFRTITEMAREIVLGK